MPQDNELAEFVTGLALNLAHHEVRLALDYAERLKEFQSVFLLAKSLGYEDIARAVAPRQISAGKMEVEGRVSIAETREKQFALKLLNLGFTRKYKQSKFVTHGLRISVETLPLPLKTHAD